MTTCLATLHADQRRLDASAERAMSALRTAQSTHPALAGTLTQALARAKTPAEKRVIHLQAEADRYAESVTRGMDATESQRKSVAQRRMVELLTGAFKEATKDLGEALDLLETEAKEVWCDSKPVPQAAFEAAWFSEQPALYLGWKELQRRALRCF